MGTSKSVYTSWKGQSVVWTVVLGGFVACFSQPHTRRMVTCYHFS